MTVSAQAFADFPVQFQGQLLRSNDAGYDDSHSLFNSIHADQRPGLIARCRNEDDVVLAVKYAADKGIPLSVRGGGHSADGAVMPQDQLVLDMTLFKRLEVDLVTRRMRIGAGVLLGELDAASSAHGLVVPAGTVSHTGAAGLTLGGGVGYNMRRFGATVDSLLSCDVVTTDGRRVRASLDENPDLFWALRGGGGNFGIVTAFEFQAHQAGPKVYSGVIVYPVEQAEDVLRGLRSYLPQMPRELQVIGALTQCPPLPMLAPELYGQPVLMLITVYTGPLTQADAVIAQVAALGRPVVNLVGEHHWTETNSMLDEIAPWGRRLHTAGGYFSEMSDEALAISVAHSQTFPTPTAPGPSTVQNWWCMGGAISEDFDEDACAFSREGAQWFWESVAQWDGAEHDDAFKAWVDQGRSALLPYMRANGYVNLTVDRGPEWLKGLYGSPAKYERLIDAKTKWDPHNMLRFNKNFKPRT